jgi:uracil-DNA glycosylase
MSNWNNTNLQTIPYHTSYNDFFQQQFTQNYFNELQEFITNKKENYKKRNVCIFPPKELVFNIFNLVPINNIKVVIIGQDPYIRKNEATGMSFSVPKTTKIPPSLVNIYKELQNDTQTNFTIPNHGDLTPWTTQGVFLLNASLTVLEGKSNSHQKYWQPFTNNFITYLSTNYENIVFCLWGNFAKSKEKFIKNNEKHYIIKTAHPSPLSIAHEGSIFEKKWFGNHQFSKINDYLLQNQKKPIDWKLS